MHKNRLNDVKFILCIFIIVKSVVWRWPVSSFSAFFMAEKSVTLYGQK